MKYQDLSDTSIIEQHGVYVHPTWDGDVNKGFDVAILKLPKYDKIKFNKHLKPIKLEGRDVPEFARYYMLGFGRLNRDAASSKNEIPKKLKRLFFDFMEFHFLYERNFNGTPIYSTRQSRH